GLIPFAEISGDTRVHDLNTDSSGYQRNSNGLTGKVGTKFELTRLLTGEAAIGYTRRVYEDPRLEDISGLIGDASLIYTASALTTVKMIGGGNNRRIDHPRRIRCPLSQRWIPGRPRVQTMAGRKPQIRLWHRR